MMEIWTEPSKSKTSQKLADQVILKKYMDQ